MDPSLRFLDAGRGVASLMRSLDWSRSPLGPPASWPQALRSVVGLLLASKFPMFVAWGPQLGFIYNDAYAEILGKKHPDAMGGRFQDIWGEIWGDILPLIERALAGEASFQENLPLLMHRKGYDEQTWFTFSYSPVFDEHGEVAGMYCACFETTAVVLGARHREREIERLHQLFRQAPALIAVLRGPRHVYELANEAYLALVGQRELIGRPMAEALPELVGQGFDTLLDNVYRTGVPYRGHAVPVRLLRNPDTGLEERFIDYIYQPIRDGSGAVSGVFVQGSDVTEAVVAMRDLRESERRKDEFLAMLAHELRNPLAPISSAAHVLRIVSQDDARAQRASEVILRQVGHMVELVDDLLDVSRVTRGLVELQPERLAVGAIVAHAVEQARPLLDARGHVLAVELPQPSPQVVGDRVRLTQVVSNLLNNAAKYTPPGGRIVVHVATQLDRVLLSVADDGIGIDAALLPHVFNLFAQAERTPDRAQGGLGIGLALARTLTELHGGTLTAHSDGANTGATFTLALPLAPERADAGPTRKGTPAPAARHGWPRSILVVDDNADGAASLAELLLALGHAPQTHTDPVAALRAAQRERYDALVVDIGMPGMDGYQFARHVRGGGASAGSLLIALTGYGQPGDRERSQAAGFDAHLVKPVDTADLTALLDALPRQRA